MRHLWKSMAIVLALGIGLGACANDMTGPEPEPMDPAYGLLGGLLGGVTGVVDDVVDTTVETVEGVVHLLLGAVVRLDPPDSETVVTRWVGPRGGVVSGGGVELRIPRGALREYTRITLRVPASAYVEAELLPHGLQFERPAALRFDMSGTSVDESDSFVGAYFLSQIVDGVIEAEETYPAELVRGVVEFRINHFSWYAPARRGYTPAGGE